MMKVIYGTTKSKDLVRISKYIFKWYFQPQWLEDDFVKQMILDIDKSEVVSPYCINNPMFGQIAPDRLSGSVKGLILIHKCKDYREYLSTMFGDNCAPWIAKLSKMVDFTLYMNHPLNFMGDESVDAVGKNGEILKTAEDVFQYYIEEECKESRMES